MADLYYYETGYIDDSYFVYTADADSAISSSATLNCDAGKINEAVATLTVTTSITATISSSEGADIFAFSEAAIAVTIEVIREANIAATAVFDIATDGRRFRDLASAEEAVFNFDIVNSRSRAFTIETQAAFSFEVNGDKIKGITETISAAFSLAASAIVTKSLAASINTTASLAFRKRPWEIKRVYNPSSSMEFRTGVFNNSLFVPVTPSLNREPYIDYFVGSGLSITGSQKSIVIDFRLYPDVSTNGQYQIMGLYTQSTGTYGWKVMLERVSSSSYNIVFLVNTSVKFKAPITIGAWNHISIRLDEDGASSKKAIFVNGTKSWSDASTTFTGNGTGDIFRIGTPALGSGDPAYSFEIDELRILQGPFYVFNGTDQDADLSSITVPAESYWNGDNAYTNGLFHFNNSYVDDVGNKQAGAANLTSQFNVTANAIKPIVASATLNASFAQTTDAIASKSVISSQSSEFSQSATADKITTAAADLTTVTSVSADVTLNATATAELSNEATVYCIISHIHGADLIAFTNSELTATAEATKPFLADLMAESTVAADYGRVRDTESMLNAAASIETAANIDAVGAAALSSEFTLYAEPVELINITETFSSEFGLTVVGSVTRTTSVSMSAETAMTVIGRESSEIAAAVNINSTLTSTVDRIRSGAATVDSAITILVDGDRRRNTTAAIESDTNVTASSELLASASAELTTTSTLTGTISHIEGADITAFTNASLVVVAETGLFGAAALSATVSTDITADKYTGYSSDLSSESQLAVTVTKILSGTITLESQATISAAAVASKNAVAGLASEAALTATISHIEGADLSAFSDAELTAAGTRFRGISSQLISSTSVSASVDVIRTTTATINTVSTLAINPIVIIIGSANVTAAFSQTTTATKIHQGAASIRSAMSFAVEIREIDLDTLTQYEYMIPRETWSYSIPEETREYKFPTSETRIYTIRRA